MRISEVMFYLDGSTRIKVVERGGKTEIEYNGNIKACNQKIPDKDIVKIIKSVKNVTQAMSMLLNYICKYFNIPTKSNYSHIEAVQMVLTNDDPTSSSRNVSLTIRIYVNDLFIDFIFAIDGEQISVREDAKYGPGWDALRSVIDINKGVAAIFREFLRNSSFEVPPICPALVSLGVHPRDALLVENVVQDTNAMCMFELTNECLGIIKEFLLKRGYPVRFEARDIFEVIFPLVP